MYGVCVLCHSIYDMILYHRFVLECHFEAGRGFKDNGLRIVCLIDSAEV